MTHNSFLNLTRTRRTAYRFRLDSISDELLDQILEAARWAPSFLNTQPWRFVVIRDPSRIDQLVRACPYGVFHFSPAILIVLVIPREYIAADAQVDLSKGKLNRAHAFLNLGFPAFSMILEAHDLGLASSLLTPDETITAPLLGLRNGDTSPVMVGIGLPKESDELDEKEPVPSRKSLNDLVDREYFSFKTANA